MTASVIKILETLSTFIQVLERNRFGSIALLALASFVVVSLALCALLRVL
jgi:hypothetical protein